MKLCSSRLKGAEGLLFVLTKWVLIEIMSLASCDHSNKIIGIIIIYFCSTVPVNQTHLSAFPPKAQTHSLFGLLSFAKPIAMVSMGVHT